MRKLAILINMEQCKHFGIQPNWAATYPLDLIKEGCSVMVYYTGGASIESRNALIQKQLLENGYRLLLATVPGFRRQPEREEWNKALCMSHNGFDLLTDQPNAWVSFEERFQEDNLLNRLVLQLASEFGRFVRPCQTSAEEAVVAERKKVVSVIVEQIFKTAKWEQ